jgi:hypothetical protein
MMVFDKRPDNFCWIALILQADKAIKKNDMNVPHRHWQNCRFVRNFLLSAWRFAGG